VPGQVKYVPSAIARPLAIDGTRSRVKVTATDRVFTSFCVEGGKKGAMTINQYYFHPLSGERETGLILFPKPCPLPHATVNKRKTEKNPFHFLSFFWCFFYFYMGLLFLAWFVGV